MSVPFFRAVYFVALASLLSVLCACTGELTEIMVVVDSDLNVPGELDRVIIDVEGLGNQDPVETMLSGFSTLPLSLGLVNEGDRLGPINVRVTARRGSSTTPVLVASRNGVLFKKGKTMMLRIDLLRACLSDESACIRSCADGTCLTEWRGLPNKIDESDGGRQDADDDAGDDDAGDDDAGSEDAGDAGPDASDAMIDSGPIDPCAGTGVTCFNYAPANFDPTTLMTLTDNVAVSIDCLTAEFDSTTLDFNGWCGPTPTARELDSADPTAPVVIAVASLTITSGGVLRVVGNRPVIFAVFGNATVAGVLDASALADVPGAGGNVSCTVGTGPAGVDRAQNNDERGGNGGGGGGFGSAGANAGRGDISITGASAVVTVGGMSEGEATLTPLRGGCAGGRGGRGTAASTGALTGGGGGAVQVSVAGTLTVTGVIAAGGGGGGKAPSLEDGGGGGGSGGAILLEAEHVVLGPTASFNANGGGGGGGFDYNADSDASLPGGDAPRLMPVGGAGGPGDNRGGNGGAGASEGVAASAGDDGAGGTPIFDPAFGAGGGGGGGGVGRIRLRDNTLSAGACTLTSGTFSPLPSIVCGG